MLKIDLHIHSVHSGHAYGTFYDIVVEARRKKLDMIAITDHGPAMDGSAPQVHFFLGYRLPMFNDIKVLWGCEANVLNEGKIDLPEKYQKRIDILMLALHKGCNYKDMGIQKNTENLKKALSNPKVKVLTHPERQQYDIDFEEICQFAVKNNVLLELNLSYMKDYGEQNIEKIKRIVDISRENEKKVIVNSDAHFIHEIGDDSILDRYKERIGLTDDMIINNYPDELMEFLKK